jgi:hypothetical protein
MSAPSRAKVNIQVISGEVVMRLIAVFTGLLIAGLLMGNQGTQTATAGRLLQSTQAATDAAGAELTVLSRDELPFTGGEAFLSPDGSRIAHVKGAQLCIYAASGVQEHCTNPKQEGDPRSIDTYFVRWSPDSQKITFTDNFLRFLLDPDIRVMDAASGKLSNITDDGTEKFNISASNKQQNGHIDIAPFWSADSKRIFFVRCFAPCTDFKSPTALYAIDASGGRPEKLGSLNAAFITVYSLALTADGKQLVYMVANQGKDHPDNGLWLADAAGQNAKQILQQEQPISVQLSADDQYVLGYSPYREALRLRPVESTDHRIVELTTGKTVEIDDQHPAMWPGWAPTGSAVAYIVREKDPDSEISGLYIAERPGAVGKLVYPSPSIGVVTLTRGVQWASNNTMLVHEKGKHVLLHLGTK